MINAIRLIRDSKTIATEGSESRVDPIFPLWVWKGHVAADASLCSLLVYSLLVIEQVETKKQEEDEAVAVALWCMAGLLGDDAMLRTALERWPRAKPYLEDVGEDRPDPEPPKFLSTQLGGAIMSTACAVMPKWGGPTDADRCRLHGEISRMGRVLWALSEADRDDVARKGMELAEANIRAEVQKIREVSQGGNVALIAQAEQAGKAVLKKIEGLLPMDYADDIVELFVEQNRTIVKLIEAANTGVAKAEKRLEALACDAIKNAEKIGGAAQDVCRSKAEREQAALGAKQLLDQALSECLKDLDSLWDWKQVESPSTSKSPQVQAIEPAEHRTSDEVSDPASSKGSGDGVMEAEIDRLNHALERERAKKRAAELLLAEVKNERKISESQPFVPTEDLMSRLPSGMSLTPEAALSMALMARPRLRVLPSAWRSAKKVAHFHYGVKLLGLLLLLGGEYAQALDNGDPDAKARLIFGQDRYKANESDAVMSRADLVRERTFDVDGKPVVMDRHLAIGVKNDTRETLRVHFERIEGQFVIGHCGQHLSIPEKV